MRSQNKPSCSVAYTSSKVSFNSKVDEGLRIQQLSGGQKSLVALATGEFLFAIFQHYSLFLRYNAPVHFFFNTL